MCSNFTYLHFLNRLNIIGTYIGVYPFQIHLEDLTRIFRAKILLILLDNEDLFYPY